MLVVFLRGGAAQSPRLAQIETASIVPPCNSRGGYGVRREGHGSPVSDSELVLDEELPDRVQIFTAASTIEPHGRARLAYKFSL